MQYRKMGRSGLDVSVIGLGAEHLEHAPFETIRDIVDVSMDHGVNYVDLFMGSPNVRDHFGTTLVGRRHKMMIAGHIGATWQDNQYKKTRNLRVSKRFVEDLLTRLKTDYIDVLMLHFVDSSKDYDKVFGPEGLLDAALMLKSEGKVRNIGMSSHYASASLRAVESGYLDTLMFPVNPVFDVLNGDMAIDKLWEMKTYEKINNQKPDETRAKLFRACEKHGTAIIAMKVYAGGLLLDKNNFSSIALTPDQAIGYALSRPAVASALTGVRSLEQMQSALHYLYATDSEKDFSFIHASSKWDFAGRCMYCNHCLPCPAGIDIGAATRLLDAAREDKNDAVVKQYELLINKPSACTKCGLCETRCPFAVKIRDNMSATAELFV